MALNVVMMGPPGAGKGTQAERFAREHGIPKISTGDMLREAVASGTELGRLVKATIDRGHLVDDETIIGVVRERLTRDDVLDGFVLDGFPRNVEQAQALQKELDRLGRDVTAALLIELDDEEVVRRLSGRRVCVKNGHLYHVEFDPPKNDSVCDQDGSKLVQRDDDHPDTVKHRLEVYRDQTSPVAELYDERGVLRRFDGARSTSEVERAPSKRRSTLRSS